MPKEIQEEESIDQYREKRVKEQEIQVGLFVQNEKELVEKIGALQNPNQHLLDKLSKAKEQIFLHKVFVYMYKNILADKDIRAEMALTSSPGVGNYDSGGLGQSVTDWGDERSTRRYVANPIIFLAVGKVEEQQHNVVYFTPEGKVATLVRSWDFYHDFRPLPSQTHPNPKDFKIDLSASSNNPKSYPYKGQTPGQALRHEIKHDAETRNKWIQKGEISDDNEYNIDMEAMEGIRNAWEKWEKSGFTDNSGYYFVFSLPEGGYILTKHESSSDSSTRSEA